MTTKDKDPIVTVPMGRGAWQGPASETPIIEGREVLATTTAETAHQLTELLIALDGPGVIEALTLARHRIDDRRQQLINETLGAGDA